MRLPSPLGQHSVGFAAFTIQVIPKIVGRARLTDGTPALKLEELSFSAFYPAAHEHRWHKGVDWLPRPVGALLNGYATFMGISRWLLLPIAYVWAALLKIPAFGSAKLQPRPLVECDPLTGEAKWPVVIFSHGLGGTRTAYSQFCANLASEGYVVLAIEHRDRSGPMVIVHSQESNKDIEMPYLKQEGVQWKDVSDKPEGSFPWRVEQLEFRRAEVYETFKAFSDAVNGNPGAIQSIDTKKVFDWSAWKDKVECGHDVTLAGHSFGSATAISILSQPPTQGFKILPLTRVILLDPWVEPFPPSGPIPFSADSSRPAACIITSEAFAIWDSHFQRLQEIVKGWKAENTTAHLMTILRSKHHEFSDFGVIAPGARRAVQVIKGTHETIMKFMHGNLDADLKGKGRVMELEQAKKKQIKGEPGELFVHE